jgi:hypothetical protein
MAETAITIAIERATSTFRATSQHVITAFVGRSCGQTITAKTPWQPPTPTWPHPIACTGAIAARLAFFTHDPGICLLFAARSGGTAVTAHSARRKRLGRMPTRHGTAGLCAADPVFGIAFAITAHLRFRIARTGAWSSSSSVATREIARKPEIVSFRVILGNATSCILGYANGRTRAASTVRRRKNTLARVRLSRRTGRVRAI